jgi:hypothetical protein
VWGDERLGLGDLLATARDHRLRITNELHDRAPKPPKAP